ncbi:MAG: type B DNA-directed DNA polymerase, partial [Nitrososphaerota archaeon]
MKHLFFLGAGYDGQEKRAILKMLDIETQKVTVLKDTSGHRPYCYTTMKVEEVINDQRLREAGATHFQPVEKYDPLEEAKVTVTKIFATDPLAVG